MASGKRLCSFTTELTRRKTGPALERRGQPALRPEAGFHRDLGKRLSGLGEQSLRLLDTAMLHVRARGQAC